MGAGRSHLEGPLDVVLALDFLEVRLGDRRLGKIGRIEAVRPNAPLGVSSRTTWTRSSSPKISSPSTRAASRTLARGTTIPANPFRRASRAEERTPLTGFSRPPRASSPKTSGNWPSRPE